MASPVAELEAGLLAMQALKPPGVSGSKIKDLTTLCVNNIQFETVLIQKIFTHFKRTSGTHKLGVLYVVDSVTRKWMDQAKQHGQVISSDAQDGSYAAGVHRVTELMPSFMNDIMASAPDDQKDKIRKLVDIWEKSQTFPMSLLESWKAKLNTGPLSTTPPGSPPPGALAAMMRSSAANPAPPAALPAMPNIMETLANIARQNASAAPSNPSIAAPPAPVMPAMPSYSAPAPQPAASSSVLPAALVAALAQAQAQTQPAPGALPFFPTPQPPATVAQPPVAAPATLPFQLPGQFGQPPASALPYTAVPPAASSQANAAPPLDPNAAAQQLMLIQTLLAKGVAPDMVVAVVQQLSAGGANANPAAAAAAAAQPHFPQGPAVPNFGIKPDASGWASGRPVESRDHDRDYATRSPKLGGSRGRSRSRSPRRGQWDGGRSDRDQGGRGGRSEYRQRSPQGQGRQGSPRRDGSKPERLIEFDRSLPDGHIRVLSRTLFIGGVTCSEAELRSIFTRFGEVQTCIVNRDKRHGFVKMLTRKDAEKAKEGMADFRHSDHQLRTRWGVGFGPRDCSDYAAGISVIPIHRLTEADRKWMLTAPFGGTGGKPLAGGMVVEEPDIEIGAGVSSKAMSRRMQTDRGGMHGPRSNDGGKRRGGHGGGRRGGGDGGDSNPNNISIPDFGFGISTGNNGMPVFPPGFSFPAPDNSS